MLELCHFRYVIDGLSPAELRVLLQTDPPEEPLPSWAHLGNLSDGRLLWQAEYHTHGLWKQAQLLYTCEAPHKASWVYFLLYKI
jgi:hypothetical protein